MKITQFVTACMLALTAAQMKMAEASPPPEVGGPGRCINPNQNVYRCNMNEYLDAATEAAVLADLMAHKQRIVDLVTAGDMEGYVAQFTDDVIYYFDDGVYRGRDEVLEFVQSVVGSGKPLTITNTKARVLSARHVTIVSAEWKLGAANGLYLHEDYYKQDDGTWKCPTISFETLS